MQANRIDIMTDLFDFEFNAFTQLMENMGNLNEKRQELERMKNDILEAERGKLNLK